MGPGRSMTIGGAYSCGWGGLVVDVSGSFCVTREVAYSRRLSQPVRNGVGCRPDAPQWDRHSISMG